ncbi:MAG TPA: hypothetical protein PLY93_13530 [Turneriella sp.]|nr:hypothetical protein [Turneriella sp.]
MVQRAFSAWVVIFYFFSCPSLQSQPPQKHVETVMPKEKKENPPPTVVIQNALLNPYESEIFSENCQQEYDNFGTQKREMRYKKKKFRGSVVEQRSGRKRLYDHNIFLRSLFAGGVTFNGASLDKKFDGALFLDIGSAILFGEGAVTVRDLYEDAAINTHLTIIASDINDASNKSNRYIAIYRNKKNKLPFPVVEVEKKILSPKDFLRPLRLYFKSDDQPVILRSTNSGPDLYYDVPQAFLHLRSATAAFFTRDVLYLFNKYILYKPKRALGFIILGEIDAAVGVNHRASPWENIDWDKRTFDDAVKLNRYYK